MNKIKVEEILTKNFTHGGILDLPTRFWDELKSSIKEIVELSIDKCAENARTTSRFADYGGGENEYHSVDEDSILQVKQMIDYE